MKSKTYKILVLSNLNDSTDTILRSTISLAKIINGEIHLFYVKQPTELIQMENQLSAKRTINREQVITDKKFQNIIQPFLEQHEINIGYSFAFGNIKEEIENSINEYKPDIVVLGKRKPKSVALFGDSITQFVLKKHDGVIMIASDENPLEPNELISLGFLDGLEETFNVDFADDLLEHIQKPMKAFKVVKSTKEQYKAELSRNEKIVEYVFEHRDGALQNVSNYLSKSKVNLLCIDRNQEQSKAKSNHMMTDFKEAINEFNVSVLLSGVSKPIALQHKTVKTKI